MLGSGTFTVRGQLLPRSGGRRVLLQGRAGGQMDHAGAHAGPGRAGAFGLALRADGAGPAGTARSLRRRSQQHRGSRVGGPGLYVLRQSVASWYDDAGTTGCGFHADYGVANVSLPCGTRVTFSYGGRRVTADGR